MHPPCVWPVLLPHALACRLTPSPFPSRSRSALPPSGVVITRFRYVLALSSDVEYLNSRDATIMGSRNGHAPLYLWCAPWAPSASPLGVPVLCQAFFYQNCCLWIILARPSPLAAGR